MEHGAADQPFLRPELRGMDRRPENFHPRAADIDPGEELTFDYGFDVDCYEDHPCLCGKHGCVGYIVSREQVAGTAERA